MNELPQDAHPTAKAFFDALDQYNEEQQGVYEDRDFVTNKDDDNSKARVKALRAPSLSESLKRKSQSLGWRNRHSQNECYPVTVLQSLAGIKSKTKNFTSSEQQSDCTLRRRNFSVRQVQRGEVEGTYGTGATVWPAAVVLIKYLERKNNYGINRNGDNKDSDGKIYQNVSDDLEVTVRGRHVVDLGGGTAVTSIAAALLGATSVVCTDGEESVVRLARSNILRASHQLSMSCCSSQSKVPDDGSHTKTTSETTPPIFCEAVEDIRTNITDEDHDDTGTTAIIDDCPIWAQKYWWGDGTCSKLKSRIKNKGLAILIADCVLPKLYPIAPLVQAIDECLRLQDDNQKCDERQSTSQRLSSSYAILSYEHRYYPDYDPRIEFRRLASERSLNVSTVPKDEMDPVYSLEDVEIWIVRRIRCQ